MKLVFLYLYIQQLQLEYNAAGLSVTLVWTE
jgi:hypothetical protein